MAGISEDVKLVELTYHNGTLDFSKSPRGVTDDIIKELVDDVSRGDKPIIEVIIPSSKWVSGNALKAIAEAIGKTEKGGLKKLVMKGIRPLEGMESLEKHLKDLLEKSSKHLEHLDISGCKFSSCDDLKKALTVSLESLRVLKMNGVLQDSDKKWVINEVANAFTQYPILEHLELNTVMGGVVALTTIMNAVGGTLRTFCMANALLQEEDYIKLLDYLDTDDFENLSLYNCANVGDETIKKVSRCKKLRLLNISLCPNVSNEAMETIGDMKNLEDLRIFGCEKVDDDGIKRLAERAGAKGLKKLDIFGLPSIKEVKTLETLVSTYENLEEVKCGGCGVKTKPSQTGKCKFVM